AGVIQLQGPGLRRLQRHLQPYEPDEPRPEEPEVLAGGERGPARRQDGVRLQHHLEQLGGQRVRVGHQNHLRHRRVLQARAAREGYQRVQARPQGEGRSGGPRPIDSPLVSRPGPIELPSQYAPAEVEGPRYERWEKAGYFTADAQSEAPAYTIVIPPPNVTGSLHIGHALDHTLIDALVRRRRMQGYNTLWLPGTDHAGIATQNVVERELAKEGLSRHDLGRTEFVERVWQWKGEYGGKILGQMRRLGDSVDWTRERFTMDDGLSRAVQTIFKRLFDDGLIYRAQRIINWCPRCMTALSDIEVDHTDDDGELVSIRYGEGDTEVVVATTRVETMLGDTAVAVHPEDPRYTHLVGK